MTREEAIETLKLLKPNMRFDNSGWLYTKQALEMAIKALSQECVGSTQKHVRNALEMHCNDAISRAYIEPIIEELENICVNADEYILNLLADIKNAPSVTQKGDVKNV